MPCTTPVAVTRVESTKRRYRSRQPRPPGFVEQHVARLDVTMHDAARVHVRQRGGEHRAEIDDDLGRQRSAPQPRGQALALDEIHHHEGATVAIDPGVADRDQPDVPDAGQHLAFAVPAASRPPEPGGKTLIATLRPLSWSQARNTLAVSPCPTSPPSW